VIGYCSGGRQSYLAACTLRGIDAAIDFGVEDTRPSPADTEKTRDALEKFGKKYEFHTYDGAGHAFFAVDRPNYRQAAAIDGWKKVFDFYGRYLR
jgi:carboxymethylenebutenolidase